MARADPFDPYRILGVARDATPRQLARAYRRQAKRFHPDLHGPDASREMRDLNRSWHILSDPDRRRAWDSAHPGSSSASHWSGAPARPRPGTTGRAMDAAAWAAWEAAPPMPKAERVRVAEAWPRPRPRPAPAPAGMRDSPWLAAAVAGGLVVAILALGWVASAARGADSPRDAFAELRIQPLTTLPLDEAQVAAVFTAADGSLALATATLHDNGWEGRVLEARQDVGGPTVRLVIQDATSPWRSLVYGRAPQDAVQARLSIASAGGEVDDGVWLMGTRSPLSPEQLIWWFEDADGEVLLSGNGELH